MQKNEKIAFVISFGFILFLFLASILFYRERMLFVDPAFTSFEIINTQNFVISEHRYGAFITQIFPLLAVYLGLSVQSILILYSASFYLFFASVVFLSGQIFKQYKLAILLVFYLSLIVSDVYFWPNNEIHQAVAWMILFLSVFKWAQEKNWQVQPWTHLLLVFALFFATISHILVGIPLLFICLYFILDLDKAQRKKINYIGVYALLILGSIALRYLFSKSSWYDGVKLEAVQQIDLQSIKNSFTNAQARSMLQLLFSKYWLSLILFIWGIFSLVQKRKFLHLALTFIFALGYFVLVTLTYPEAITETNLFYFESQWMCWAIILTLPFIQESIEKIQQPKIIILLFLFIFLSKLPLLNTSLNKFQNRLSQLENIVDLAKKQENTKAYIYNTVSLKDAFFMSWGLPAETMLLSALNKEETSINLRVFEEEIEISQAQDSIYSNFKLLPISALNAKYFRLDSTNRYKPLIGYKPMSY